MKTIYENLLGLVESKAFGNHAKLFLASENVIIQRGGKVASVSPSNIATFYVNHANIGVNVLFGQLGLGAIVTGTTAKSRLVYWLNGVSHQYEQGMTVNLLTNEVSSKNLAEVVINEEKHREFRKHLKVHAAPAKAYLRLLEKQPSIGQEKYDGPTPDVFVQAVLEGNTPLIATIPITCNRGFRRGRDMPMYEQYDALVKQYLDQNRAAIYKAAGIT